jgi:hypothetical protein
MKKSEDFIVKNVSGAPTMGTSLSFLWPLALQNISGTSETLEEALTVLAEDETEMARLRRLVGRIRLQLETGTDDSIPAVVAKLALVAFDESVGSTFTQNGYAGYKSLDDFAREDSGILDVKDLGQFRQIASQQRETTGGAILQGVTLEKAFSYTPRKNLEISSSPITDGDVKRQLAIYLWCADGDEFAVMLTSGIATLDFTQKGTRNKFL